MQIHDVDWRTMFNTWSDADLHYLRSIIDEKIANKPRRKTLICKAEG